MVKDFFILCFLFRLALSPASLLTQPNMPQLPQKAKYFQDFYTIEDSSEGINFPFGLDKDSVDQERWCVGREILL